MSSAFFLLSLWPDRIIKDAPLQNHIGLIWLNHIFQHGHQLQKMDFTRILWCGKNLGILPQLRTTVTLLHSKGNILHFENLCLMLAWSRPKLSQNTSRLTWAHNKILQTVSESGEKQHRTSENMTTVHVSSSWSWLFSLAFGSLFYR